MTSARSFTLSGVGGGRSDISSLSSWRHRQHSDDDNAAGHEGKSLARLQIWGMAALRKLFPADVSVLPQLWFLLLLGGTAVESTCVPAHPLAHCAGDSAGGALAAGDVRRTLSSSADLAAALDDVRSGSSVAALQDELAEKNRIIEQLQVCATRVVVWLIAAALWEHVCVPGVDPGVRHCTLFAVPIRLPLPVRSGGSKKHSGCSSRRRGRTAGAAWSSACATRLRCPLALSGRCSRQHRHQTHGRPPACGSARRRRLPRGKRRVCLV